MPGSDKKLWFRGVPNLDATLDWLHEHAGLDGATEVMLAGESAGGLSTFLHADRVGRRLKAGSPSLKTYKAQPIVGYFQDHDNFGHTDGYGPDGKTGGQCYFLMWPWPVYVYLRIINSTKNLFHEANSPSVWE